MGGGEEEELQTEAYPKKDGSTRPRLRAFPATISNLEALLEAGGGERPRKNSLQIPRASLSLPSAEESKVD
jgi:hypothetical protein